MRPQRQPAHRWVEVPDSWGRWGHTPLWAITGRLRSEAARVSATDRSRIERFQEGSAWPSFQRRRPRRTAFGSPLRPVRGSLPHGSWCAHQTSSDGWWASSSTAWRARSAGRRLGLALQRPLDREVLPEQDALAVGLVVELGAGDVAVDPHEVQPGVGGHPDVGGDLGRGGLGQQLAGGADRRCP